jgi:hypothetical protein
MCLLENVQNYGLLLLHNNNMKSKSIYTVGTVLKSNIKIVERAKRHCNKIFRWDRLCSAETSGTECKVYIYIYITYK